MRYEGALYRPPSEASSYILQATIGCSHNLCVYCDMYRAKKFRVRDLKESLHDLELAGARFGRDVEKMFVADGDALILDMEHWLPLLDKAAEVFPNLRQVSCYAMASNVLNKTQEELETLASRGLSLLYIGPESGDPVTLKRLVKGATHEEHVEAAQRAHAAGMRTSVIVLLGAGGVERSQVHAAETARLISGMDPHYVSALTLTVIPGTPMERMQAKSRFELPETTDLLRELRTIVGEARPTNATFRTNHASNYLPLAGQLPHDRERIVAILEQAIHGEIPLRPEWSRGL